VTRGCASCRWPRRPLRADGWRRFCAAWTLDATCPLSAFASRPTAVRLPGFSWPTARYPLATDNGVVVDSQLRSSDPDVFCAGDIANAYHPFFGKHLRVEHWANALHQQAVAANAMIGGDSVYERLPYFYTDQYDVDMEYIGHVEPEDNDNVVIRGDARTWEFIAFWTRDAWVLAGMNVSVWDVTATVNNSPSPRDRSTSTGSPTSTFPLGRVLD
jgi:hypothetical protein